MTYPERPYYWYPENDPPVGLILCLTEQPILNQQQYLDHLTDRVIWLIQQEEDMSRAHRVIQYWTEQSNPYRGNWPDADASAWEWAAVVTEYNFELQDYQRIHYPEYPYHPQPCDEDSRLYLEENDLEAWMEQMVACFREWD